MQEKKAYFQCKNGFQIPFNKVHFIFSRFKTKDFPQKQVISGSIVDVSASKNNRNEKNQSGSPR